MESEMSINISTLLLSTILIIAVWMDLKQHRIPNLLTVIAAISGLVLQITFSGLDGLQSGLGGLLVGLVTFLPFFMLGGMGAGDVKLMAAVGTFLGPVNTLFAVGLTLVAGGLLGLFVLTTRRDGRAALRRYSTMLKVLAYTGGASYAPPRAGETAAVRFPYALAIASGTLLAWGLMVL